MDESYFTINSTFSYSIPSSVLPGEKGSFTSLRSVFAVSLLIAELALGGVLVGDYYK